MTKNWHVVERLVDRTLVLTRHSRVIGHFVFVDARDLTCDKAFMVSGRKAAEREADQAMSKEPGRFYHPVECRCRRFDAPIHER